MITTPHFIAQQRQYLPTFRRNCKKEKLELFPELHLPTGPEQFVVTVSSILPAEPVSPVAPVAPFLPLKPVQT